MTAFLGLFLGGAAAGGTVARVFAPGAWIAEVTGFFALPVAFAAGLQVWYGLALLSLVPRLFRIIRHPTLLPARPRLDDRPGIPGSFVFLPFGSIAGAAAGIVIGLVSSTTPAWLVAVVFWIVGTGHGALAWCLAHRGFLIPPEST